MHSHAVTHVHTSSQPPGPTWVPNPLWLTDILVLIHAGTHKTQTLLCTHTHTHTQGCGDTLSHAHLHSHSQRRAETHPSTQEIYTCRDMSTWKYTHRTQDTERDLSVAGGISSLSPTPPPQERDTHSPRLACELPMVWVEGRTGSLPRRCHP